MRFKHLESWLQWLEQLHPSEIELGLDRVSQVYTTMAIEMDLPMAIVVAGTNGKGSCVALLSEIYQLAGYQVGSYTSPHLYAYNERIKINGASIDDESLCLAFEQVDQARDSVSLSYFEFGTLAALAIFAQRNLDLIILEVGLGGRLDAVNIVDSEVALISSIDLDHCEWLGDTRERIAFEKAGVMRSQNPVVCGDQHPPMSLITHSSELGAPLHLLNREFSYEIQARSWNWRASECEYIGLPWPALAGEHQFRNSSAVLMTIALLQHRFPVSEIPLREALKRCRLMGRLEEIQHPGQPRLLFDVAHNSAAVAELADFLRRQNVQRVHAVFAALQRKAIREMVDQIADVISTWHLAKLTDQNSALPSDVAQILLRYVENDAVQIHSDIKTAYRSAMKQSSPNDCIVVFGSFYTVAEARIAGLEH